MQFLRDTTASRIIMSQKNDMHFVLDNRGYTQKNGAVSKVNQKFISHLTRAQLTPSAAATVQVSHVLPAVRFSCLLRAQFPRWRRSRKRRLCAPF